MTNVVYGLTRQTLDIYRMAVSQGFSWDAAMTHLKRLYQSNKEFALYVNQPDFSNVYGHHAYVSKARSERIQADQG